MMNKRFSLPRVLSTGALAAAVALAPYSPAAFASTGAEGQTNGSTAAETGVSVNNDAPAVLPGDFFYFFKTMMEKIELALTFDDAEKAKRLAEFAEERLAEAKALLDQGDIEQAKEVLANALKQQEAAWDVYEGTKQTDEQNGETAETDIETLRQQLEEKFSQNITALQAALERVKNPRAKEVLARNIEKAKQKLEAKIEKRLANQTEQSSQVEETDDEPTAPTDETEEAKNESAPSAPESAEIEKPAAAPAEDDTAVQLDEQADTAIKAETKSSLTPSGKTETKVSTRQTTAADAKGNGREHQAVTAGNKQAAVRASVSVSQPPKQTAKPQTKHDHSPAHGKQNKEEKNGK